MTDWETISRLCREALSRDPAERKAYLDEACGGDPELRWEVDALLPSTEGSGGSGWFTQGMNRLWDAVNATEPSADGSTHDRTPDERTPKDVLFTSSPFSLLRAETLSDLLSVMHPREFQPGDFLIREGDPAEFLLLVLSGHARAVVRGTPDDRPPVGEFRPGDIVGEISLVTDEPRTADVVARDFVRTLLLSASDFDLLAGRHPDLRVLLTEVVAERLGQSRYDGLGGKHVHGYQIVQCVGRGGMGVVYEARQVETGQKVALKMMNHRLIYQLHALRRFRREAAILATLEHPSVARLYGSFSAYKTEFLAMEFCQGQMLNRAIAARGPLREALVRNMLGQLADALLYVHGRGIVHRDLKPSNIVLTPLGTVKLLDFGIGMVERDSEQWNALKTTTRPVGLIGTPRYMAPEQFSDRAVDRRADFYSLACVAFEALSGRPVIYSSDVFDIVREHARFVLPSREAIGTGVSEQMHQVLAGGLEQDPDKRVLPLEQLAAWAGPVMLED
jgi:CRP-like cAMP-binding protein